MNLYLNTADAKTVEVSLKSGGKVIDKISDDNAFGSQVLLPLIDKLLIRNNIKLENLKGIEVHTGPGSYTGIKVGVAVANALGFGLEIPVNGKKMELELNYSNA